MIVNKFKKEINQEIEKTMTEHGQVMKKLSAAKHALENELSTFKRHRVRKVIKISCLSSVSFQAFKDLFCTLLLKYFRQTYFLIHTYVLVFIQKKFSVSLHISFPNIL